MAIPGVRSKGERTQKERTARSEYHKRLAKRLKESYTGLDGPEGTDLGWHMRQFPWIPIVFKKFISEPNIGIHRAAEECGYWNMRFQAARIAAAYEWRPYRRWFYQQLLRAQKNLRKELRMKERASARKIIDREMQKVEDAAKLMHPDTYSKFLADQERKLRAATSKAISDMDIELAEKCLKMAEIIRGLYVKLYGPDTALLDKNMEVRRTPKFGNVPDREKPLERTPEEQERLDRIERMLEPKGGKPVPDLLLPAHLRPPPGTLMHEMVMEQENVGFVDEDVA